MVPFFFPGLDINTYFHLSKKPCHQWSSQPFKAIIIHSLQLATISCSKLIATSGYLMQQVVTNSNEWLLIARVVSYNEWLQGPLVAGFFEGWFMY